MTRAARSLKLGRRHDEAEPLCATAQPAVNGDEAAIVQLRKRYVLGVVRSSPSRIPRRLPTPPSPGRPAAAR